MKTGIPIIILLLVVCIGDRLYGQANAVDRPNTYTRLLPGIPFAIPFVQFRTDTSVLICDTVAYRLPAVLKNSRFSKGILQIFLMPAIEGISNTGIPSFPPPSIPEKSLLTIHGNVLYSMDYRSYSDTPYAEKDIYYHTVQTYLDITYKEQYPFRVYLTNRFGNASFTRHFTDLNMNFNAHDFRNRIRQKISSYSPRLAMDSVLYWKQKLDLQQLALSRINLQLKDPGIIQKLVEAKERALYGLKPGVKLDSLGIDSLSFPERHALQLKKVDSLQQSVKALEKKYRQAQQQLEELKRKIPSKRGELDLKDLEMQEREVPDSVLPKGYKTLLAIRSFGIGRTLVDYSELSAKNVSITGLQAEYNPSFYLAVATGTVDYRFRDFIVNNRRSPKQYLHMIRAGLGEKNGTNIILTWYTGKKQLYNNSSNAQVTTPDYHLMGFTLEGNYRVNAHTYLTAEIAKSSLPYYNNTDKGLLATTVSMQEHSNEAYSLKLQTMIPATQTNLTGFIKQYGANFQSFSLVTTGVQQRAWLLQAEQPFFHRKLTVKASLKENDYNNPAAAAYRSNTVFKTIQATLRMPKWPVLFAGYYPSAQLTRLTDDEYVENVFYSLVANASHYYKAGDWNMNTTAMYTRFYNRQSDSGFLYFNTSNVMLNHSVFFSSKLTGQTTASLAISSDYHLYSIDNDVQYAFSDAFSLGAGIKYNRQTNFNLQQWGYKTNAMLKIKKLGEIQLMLDNGFIPGPEKKLVENKTGRVSFFRIF